MVDLGFPVLIAKADAARLLGVAEQTLDVWNCKRRYGLPFVKIGRKVFYKAEDLRAFVETRTRGRAA